MKTLFPILCGMMLYLFTPLPASTAIQEQITILPSPQNTINHLGETLYLWMSPALLPNGEYVGRTEKNLLLFRKSGAVVTGSLYITTMPYTYCVWGVIAPNGELVGGEIVLPKIYTTDEEDMQGDDEEEISVALENFDIMSWRQFKKSYEVPYGDVIESMSAVFKDCNHFFAVFDGSS